MEAGAPEAAPLELPSTSEECITLGKDLINSGRTEEAIQSFERAVKLLVESYGDTDPRCALAYYLYADALIQKVQEQADVLGNVVHDIGQDVEATEETLAGKARRRTGGRRLGTHAPCALCVLVPR